MSGVINDVEALTEFRAHLVQFNQDLAENFATIRGHWRELGEVWRDDMYRLFGEALDEVLPGITAYLAATEGHEAHLAALIERPGKVVDKDELLARAWPQTFVEESNLKMQVSALRRALGDGQRGQRYVVTVPGRGYNFVAPISFEEPAPIPAAPAISSAGKHNLPLAMTRTIGRDEIVAALVEAKIAIASGPVARSDGTALFVHDPDGARIELLVKHER